MFNLLEGGIDLMAIMILASLDWVYIIRCGEIT